MQRLLALHPGLRTPNLWELRQPFASADGAARRAAERAAEAFIVRVPAEALARHPTAAVAPEECHWLLRHNSTRATLHVAWGYWEWLRSMDADGLRRIYRHYRTTVEVLQAGAPGKRWLGKGFAHSHFWPVRFEVFPDARVTGCIAIRA